MADSSWLAVDLRRLLFGVVGGILIIVIFAFAALAWGSAERLVEPTVERQLVERSSSAASVIEGFIESASTEAKLLAMSPAVLAAVVDGSTVAGRYLEDAAVHSPFDLIIVTDGDGRVVASSGPVAEIEPSEEAWWRSAFEGDGGPSEVIADGSTGSAALPVAFAVEDGTGTPVGVLSAVLDLRSIQYTLAGIARGWGYVQLIDERGRLISDPHPEHLLERHPDEATLVPGHLVRAAGQDGQPIVGMVRTLLDGRWRTVYWVREDQAYALLHAARRAVGFGLLIALLTAIVGIIVAGSWVSREIGRPVRMVAEATDRVGGGDLRISVKRVGKGEVRKLCEAVQQMVDRLRELVSSLREASYHTQSRSQEIAGAVGQLSSGTEEMTGTLSRLTSEASNHSDTIKEVSARMDSLGAAARDLANGAEIATQRSRELRSIAEKSRERLAESNTQAGQMSERSELATSRLLEFMNASRQFGEFVDLIKQFARRTNLLALNAAIEAARAGAETRGFAVLAEEIRKLANQAGAAAERAEETTDAVLGQLETARLAVEETREATQAIGAVVESLDESFGHVTRAMGETEGWADRVAEVSADVDGSVRSTAGQLAAVVTGFGDFAAAMEQLAAGMEEQNASTEEIAGAVNALNTSAWELAGLADVFVIDLEPQARGQESHPEKPTEERELAEVAAAG